MAKIVGKKDIAKAIAQINQIPTIQKTPTKAICLIQAKFVKLMMLTIAEFLTIVKIKLRGLKKVLTLLTPH